MNTEELRMVGRDHWEALLAEAAIARRVRRPHAPRGTVRPRLARALVVLAARLDPALAPQRRATMS